MTHVTDSGSRCPLSDQLLKDDGIIVLPILGGVKDGHCAGGRLFPQSLHELPFPFEFMLVSLLEFLPSRGIMAKPFSQLVAWGRVFDPLIDDYLFLSIPWATACRRGSSFHRLERAFVISYILLILS